MKIVIGLLIVVVLVVGVILSLPFLIDLNKYQDQYKPLIEDALNRKVQLQDIRLTIWPRIGARVAGFAVLDDPAFGSSPFASLTSLDVGVKLMPLLSGKVEVEDITLRDPVITVIKNKNGVLNVSTIGRTGVALPKTPSRAPIPSTEGPLKILALLAVDRVSIASGKLTYRDLSAAKPTEYILQDMELLLQSVRLGQTPSLHVGMLVQPFNLPVRLDGTFGPLKESTDIDAINLQLALGKTDFTITGKTVGRNASLNISAPVINTANLPVALPLQKPVDVNNLRIAADVQGQDVLLQNVSFQLFDGQVTAAGKGHVRLRDTTVHWQDDDSRDATRSGAQRPGNHPGVDQRNGRSRPRRARPWIVHAGPHEILGRHGARGCERRQDRRCESASGSHLHPQSCRHLA